MPTLKEFIQSQASEKNTGPNKSGQEICLTKSIEKNLARTLAQANHPDEARFSQEAAELVTSNEFMNELSNEIGKPKQSESEDEFVERAKNSLRNLLLSRVWK